MKNKSIMIVLLLSCISCGKSIAQQSIDSLLLILQDICKNEKIPGAMISIVNSDSILFSGGIGYANMETKEPVTEKHLFRLGSISKTFTALGFVKLADEEKIKLSSPIHEISKNDLSIKNKWRKESPITIEQVLEHTAGFDDIHRHANYPKKDVGILSSSEMVESHKKSLYARWKPGVRMAYSNPGYILAGYLIEQVTNTSYDQYLKGEILTPLEMKQSGFYFRNNPEMLFATGYQKLGGKLIPVGFKSVQGGAASDFCSNAEEMSLFLQFMLAKTLKSDKELISKKWFDRIENPKTTIAAKRGFIGGYGLGNTSVWANNYLFYGHDGGIDGFSSLFLYSRKANLGVSVSINVQGNILVLIDEILDFYIGPNKYANTNTKPISKVERKKYSGFYNFKSPRNQTMYFIQKMLTGHIIEFDNNLLLVKDFGGVNRDTLYHRGDNLFFRKSEGIPFVMLLENEDGRPVLWLGGEYAEKGSKIVRITTNYLVIGALLMSIQYGFVGFIGWLIQIFKKDKKSRKSQFILWLSSMLFIVTSVVFITTIELYERPESLNLGSVMVFIGSIAFFISSIISFAQSWRLPKEGPLFKWYYRLTALSLLVVGLWLLFNNFIGFRLWAY